MSFQYQHTAIGGTFDLLHKGHLALIQRAAKSAPQISIGITTDRFCHKLGKNPYQNQKERRSVLLKVLKANRLTKKTRLVWLDDIFGTTIKNITIDSLVVSDETLNGAKLLNRERNKKKLKPLKIIVVKQIKAEDDQKISSARIKAGEISPDGISYSHFLSKIARLRFSDKIRQELKKPFGKIIKIDKKFKSSNLLISVGDITTSNLLKIGIIPNLSIIDFYVGRKKVFYNLSQLGFAQPNPDVIVKNSPGQISQQLIDQAQRSLRENAAVGQVILVDGEEDLAVIPCLLMAPLGTTIIYGQPQKGAVKVTADLKSKQQLVNLLS